MTMHVLVIVLVVLGVVAIFLELLMPGWDSYIGVFVGIAAFGIAAAIAIVFLDGALFFVGALLALLLIGGYGMYLFIKRKQLHGGMILTEVDDAPQVDLSGFVGKEGRVITVLRPAGDVDFNGIRREASSDGPFLEKGTRVRVVEIEGTKIVVAPIEAN